MISNPRSRLDDHLMCTEHPQQSTDSNTSFLFSVLMFSFSSAFRVTVLYLKRLKIPHRWSHSLLFISFDVWPP